MFFTFSKIIWLLIDPLNFIGLLFLVGLILWPLKKSVARFFVFGATSLFLIFGLLPIGSNMLVYLESQYERQLPEQIDGIIVLGSAFETKLSKIYNEPVINGTIERVISGIELKKEYPKAILLFSGGEGRLKQNGLAETTVVKQFLSTMNLKPENYEYEETSKNTFENSLNSYQMQQPEKADNWVLVTSGYHMPRAMAVFKKQGWNIHAWPTDFNTRKRYKFRPKLNVLGNFYSLQIATKEIVGIIAYKMTGKI